MDDSANQPQACKPSDNLSTRSRFSTRLTSSACQLARHTDSDAMLASPTYTARVHCMLPSNTQLLPRAKWWQRGPRIRLGHILWLCQSPQHNYEQPSCLLGDPEQDLRSFSGIEFINLVIIKVAAHSWVCVNDSPGCTPTPYQDQSGGMPLWRCMQKRVCRCASTAHRTAARLVASARSECQSF